MVNVLQMQVKGEDEDEDEDAISEIWLEDGSISDVLLMKCNARYTLGVQMLDVQESTMTRQQCDKKLDYSKREILVTELQIVFGLQIL